MTLPAPRPSPRKDTHVSPVDETANEGCDVRYEIGVCGAGGKEGVEGAGGGGGAAIGILGSVGGGGWLRGRGLGITESS